MAGDDDIPSVVTVPPRATHGATFVFIHGLGSSGAHWQPFAEKFNEPEFDHIKWILPNAPLRRITAAVLDGPSGVTMPAWYDVYALNVARDIRQDVDGHLASRRAIQRVIDAERAAHPRVPAVLGGHSQGSAMAVLSGLTYPDRLAGLVLLSGRIPVRDKIQEMASPHATSLPVFIAHGTADTTVRYELARDGYDFLKRDLGMHDAESGSTGSAGIEFHTYDGVGHGAERDAREIDDLKSWLRAVVPRSGDDRG